MRHGILPVLALVVPVLASPTQAQDLRVQIPGWDVPVLLDTIAAQHKITGPRDRVLAAIEATYAEYGLPAEGLDPALSRVPNRRVTKTGKLGKQPISRYLDCGRGFNGNNADVYRIVIASAAWPLPATGDISSIKVAIIGAGQDPGGAGRGFVQCHTRGFFEGEFARAVALKVAKAMATDTSTR